MSNTITKTPEANSFLTSVQKQRGLSNNVTLVALKKQIKVGFFLWSLIVKSEEDFPHACFPGFMKAGFCSLCKIVGKLITAI